MQKRDFLKGALAGAAMTTGLGVAEASEVNIPRSSTSHQLKQTAGRDRLGQFAPQFAAINDDVLFGQVWNDTTLPLRERSLLTVSSLISQGITDSSLLHHLQNAKANGITKAEIAAVITQIGFYAGWPKAWAAFNLAKTVWTEDGTK